MGEMADDYDCYDPDLDAEYAEERHAAECKGKLVRRQNRHTGEWFWGCDQFPACRYTQNDAPYEEQE